MIKTAGYGEEEQKTYMSRGKDDFNVHCFVPNVFRGHLTVVHRSWHLIHSLVVFVLFKNTWL